MNLITRTLILKIREIVNFIVWKGRARSSIGSPYTNDICNYWRFKTPDEAIKSSNKIFAMYLDYRDEKDFIGMDMCRKFLEMGFTRSRRYANHNSGRKYKKGTRNILPQEKDHATSKYAQSATIFKRVRDIVAKNDIYVKMRKEWRASE